MLQQIKDAVGEEVRARAYASKCRSAANTARRELAARAARCRTIIDSLSDPNDGATIQMLEAKFVELQATVRQIITLRQDPMPDSIKKVLEQYEALEVALAPLSDALYTYCSSMQSRSEKRPSREGPAALITLIRIEDADVRSALSMLQLYGANSTAPEWWIERNDWTTKRCTIRRALRATDVKIDCIMASNDGSRIAFCEVAKPMPFGEWFNPIAWSDVFTFLQ